MSTCSIKLSTRVQILFSLSKSYLNFEVSRPKLLLEECEFVHILWNVMISKADLAGRGGMERAHAG